MEADAEGSHHREEEALLLKSLAETKYKSRDIAPALKYARRALRIFPSLAGIHPLISSLEILSHAVPSSQPPDYYRILQLEPFSDVGEVRKQYKSLALLLHPDKNPNFVCEDAFKVVGEAFGVLSDKGKKESYELGLRVRMQQEGLGRVGDMGVGSEGRFWSKCRECGKLHEFDKGYLGKRLVCPGCGKSFKAVGVQDAGDSWDSESDETDEDVELGVRIENLKKTNADGVKVHERSYMRKRKGAVSNVGEMGGNSGAEAGLGQSRSAKRKERSVIDGDEGGGRGVGTEKTKRKGNNMSSGYREGVKGGTERNVDDEEEGFWDLKLKEKVGGLRKMKGKRAETLRDWISKLKVNAEEDELKNNREKEKGDVANDLNVRLRDVRKKGKLCSKDGMGNLEDKKRLVVIGLRCVTDMVSSADKSKSANLREKVGGSKNEGVKVDVNGEWGGSRRRSLRVQASLTRNSVQHLDKKSIESGEEVITLAEMQLRVKQKMNYERKKTKDKGKRIEKERDEQQEVQAGVEQEKEDRMMEQVREEEEEEEEESEKDADREKSKDTADEIGKKEQESMNYNGEKEEMSEEEGKARQMEKEKEDEIENVDDEDEEDKQEDEENEMEQEKEEMEVETNKKKEKEKGKEQVDMTGYQTMDSDKILDYETWRNGDEMEELAIDTRWTKRIRCYESKKRALSKGRKDLGVEKLNTSGSRDKQSGLVTDKPVILKSKSPRHVVNMDSDFYDFDKDRGERTFKMGQVWAIYDDLGQPRLYGLIDEVMSTNPFVMRLKWLEEQDTIGKNPTALRVACGRFKVTSSTIVKSVSMFSHEVDCERAAREGYNIYPKKGSVWAIYEGGKNNGRYEIVICLTSYSDMFGLSLAYLEKLEGFRTLYKRKEIGWHAVRWLGKDEVYLCSHQIPARRLSHEDAPDFEEDCWVLDPACLHPHLLTDGVGKSHRGS